MKRNKVVYTKSQTALICQKLLNEPTVVFDTETTGLAHDAEIVEITIIDKSGEVLFDSLIKPQRPISSTVTAIHGITNEMVSSAPSFSEVAEQIHAIMQGKNVVGHNVSYDRKRIEYEFSRIPHLTLPQVKSWACTMFLSIHHEYQKWPKLIELAKEYNIAFEGDAHRSASDTEVCRKLLVALSQIKQ